MRPLVVPSIVALFIPSASAIAAPPHVSTTDKDCPQPEQINMPMEFLEPDYMALRHAAIAVKEPRLAARFAVEVLDMCPGPQTIDFKASGMQWVMGRSPKQPFKLHFIPNAKNGSYVDALNAMTTLIEGSLSPWAQWMDNHLCIGYHDATDIVARIAANEVPDEIRSWYAGNVPGNGGTVPWIGPVARHDDVYQFYVMMPFGHLMEIQQPKDIYEAARAAGKALPEPTTWHKVRPAFTTMGRSGDIAVRKVLVRWGHPGPNATRLELTLHGTENAPLESFFVPDTQQNFIHASEPTHDVLSEHVVDLQRQVVDMERQRDDLYAAFLRLACVAIGCFVELLRSCTRRYFNARVRRSPEYVAPRQARDLPNKDVPRVTGSMLRARLRKPMLLGASDIDILSRDLTK